MAVSDIKVQGGSAAWFIPLIYGSGGDAGKLDTCGTLVPVVCVADAEQFITFMVVEHYTEINND